MPDMLSPPSTAVGVSAAPISWHVVREGGTEMQHKRILGELLVEALSDVILPPAIAAMKVPALSFTARTTGGSCSGGTLKSAKQDVQQVSLRGVSSCVLGGKGGKQKNFKLCTPKQVPHAKSQTKALLQLDDKLKKNPDCREITCDANSNANFFLTLAFDCARPPSRSKEPTGSNPRPHRPHPTPPTRLAP